MIKGKSVLAIIPARGGSKGLPGKNILELGGKPLLAWTIEAGKRSKYIDRLILSSEDAEIIRVAEEWGCEVPFVRPEEFAQDETPGIAPVLHALETLTEKYDYMILLQPTSPFRTAPDIDACLEFCCVNDSPSCVSVAEASENPYWMFSMAKDNKIEPLIRTKDEVHQRQLLPKSFILNGAIYISKTEYIAVEKSFVTKDTLAFIMHRDHSVDIDSEKDLLYAEFLLNKSQTRL
ncbi:MAG: acylneuraminate cytidylyltransferase family protein [Desulfobacteraceae bacterium]|nr:acylneuraminate cytidylyltransferase family protein [Desulfobacteraceae bacterium]